PLAGEPAADYETIIDEECKVRIKTPRASKFRDYPMEMSDRDRKQVFLRMMAGRQRTRPALVEAFFRSSAEAWRDHAGSGREHTYVGYSPIIVVDADQIVTELPEAHVLHVVRNPWSAYGDTKKRPVPLSLSHYLTGWCINQMAALTYSAMFPDRVHVLRFEDIVADPVRILGRWLAQLGIGSSPTLSQPSWNGTPLAEVYPWGTVRIPTPEANRATAEELTAGEVDEIRVRAGVLLERFGYTDFLGQTRSAA
ncbi:MAG TPA: sulfotransferase, partial [Isosphaeraceae bacterium]|nr:sulfotransferase [Isosphaeraceae bacterium]